MNFWSFARSIIPTAASSIAFGSLRESPFAAASPRSWYGTHRSRAMSAAMSRFTGTPIFELPSMSLRRVTDSSCEPARATTST